MFIKSVIIMHLKALSNMLKIIKSLYMTKTRLLIPSRMKRNK